MHQMQASPVAMRLSAVRPAAASPTSATASGEPGDMIILFVSAGLVGAVLVLILGGRASDQAERDANRECYQLAFPRDLTFDQVVAFMRSLAADRPSRWSLLGRPSVVFEVIACGATRER